MKLSLIPLVLSFAINVQPAQADLATDSERVMDQAQLAFSNFFPNEQTTQSLPPYVYRFYPLTGIYLGINQDDAGVYLLGGAFGDTPLYIDQVSNVLDLLDQKLNPVSQNQICSTENIPTGFTYTQQENTTFITTNGQCIKVAEDNKFCDVLPETDSDSQPIETNIHVLSENIISSFNITGISFPGVESIFKGIAQVKTCVIHAPTELTNHTLDIDICLDISNQLGEFSSLPGITPPVTTEFTSLSQTTRVDDCFNTDASTITNLVTQEVWKNINGNFVKVN